MPTRSADTKTRRTRELSAMLERRRLELTAVMRGRIRMVRGDDAEQREQIDADDAAAVDGEVDVALIQLTSEALRAVEAAQRRLAAGRYGDCAECQEPIAAARLRALPFAARCRRCEEAREAAGDRAAARARSTYATALDVDR
jgi:DnaK suppressor protein